MRNLPRERKIYNKLIIITCYSKKNSQKFCQFRKKIYLCTRKNAYWPIRKDCNRPFANIYGARSSVG